MDTPSPATPPPDVPAAEVATASGDLFVASSPPGAVIRMDGQDTGMRAPALLRGLPIGTHVVEVELGCGRARLQAEVAPSTIARAELALTNLPGDLDIAGTPVGARVYVDETEVGTLPWSGVVSCGPHRVDVAADGYLRARAQVDLLPGGAERVDVQLAPEDPGRLTIDVSPLHARVSLDGVALGEGPRTVGAVAPGVHTVEAHLDGYRPARAAATIEPGGVARVELALEPGRAPLPVARGVAAGGAFAAGVAAGAWSALEFLAADAAWQVYLTEPDDRAAEVVFTDRVRPHQLRAWVAAGVAGAALVGAGVVWVLPVHDGAAAGVVGTF